MINWSLLPVPECRLELERAGSPSSIHRKQLETFLISSSTHTCHWMCEWSLKFCLVSCIKAALALDAVIWFHFHPLPGCLCQAERGSWRRMLSCVLHSCSSWKAQEVPDFHSSGCILPDELLLWHINNRESSELQHLWHHCGASATTGTWEFGLQYSGSEKSDTPFTSMGNSRAEMGKCICVPGVRKIEISRLLTAGKLSIQMSVGRNWSRTSSTFRPGT